MIWLCSEINGCIGCSFIFLSFFPLTDDDRKGLWEYCNKMMGQGFTVTAVSSMDFII